MPNDAYIKQAAVLLVSVHVVMTCTVGPGDPQDPNAAIDIIDLFTCRNADI